MKWKKVKGKEPAFMEDIREEGYHIYSIDNAKIPDFYPPELPRYKRIRIKDLKVGDSITIRAFFAVGEGASYRIDGGEITLEVEFIDEESVMGVVRTVLPKEFPIQTGSSIEVFEGEILGKQ